MAEKKPKKPVEKLTLADNPSLIQAGDEIHLCVLDDFFIEAELPKWRQFKADWEALKKELKKSYPEEIENLIKKMEDPKVQEAYQKRLDSYKKGTKKLADDEWHIKEKHEKAVADAISKTARLMPHVSWFGNLMIKLGLKKAPVPVDIAFMDLKSHLIHTTTEEMAKKKFIIDVAEKKFRDLGQYNKADQIKAYASQLVEESALIAAGFDTYVTEQMMIDFISKSERGVRVDFLRLYDGVIPDDVAALKKKADEAMIFDNYVVAYYSDIKKVAKTIETQKKKDEAKKAVAKRRDPILFGIVKESRNLYYIADWVTDTDDLTLKVIEEALGQKGLKLSDAPVSVDPAVGISNNFTMSQIRRYVQDVLDDRADNYLYDTVGTNAGSTYTPRNIITYSNDDNTATTITTTRT